jgi:hypothetical protein
MLPEVEEHVDQRAPHFSGRAQMVRVVAVLPDGAAAVGGAVDGAGASHGEALDENAPRSSRLELDSAVIGCCRARSRFFAEREKLVARRAARER